jgi:hypothetical protein
VDNISDCIVLGAEAAEPGQQGCRDYLALPARPTATRFNDDRKHLAGSFGWAQGGATAD